MRYLPPRIEPGGNLPPPGAETIGWGVRTDSTVGLFEAAAWTAPQRGQNRSSSPTAAPQRGQSNMVEAYSRTIELSISRVRPANTATATRTSPSICDSGWRRVVSTTAT